MRRIALLAGMLLAAVGASAQKGISFGLRLEPNLNITRQFVDDEVTDSLRPDPRMGFGGTLFGHYGITENFGAVLGLGLAGVNTRLSDESPDKLNLVFLQVPILAQFTSYDLGGGWYLKAQAGISIDIRTGARYITPDEKLRWNDQTTPVNLAGLIGMGVEYDLLEAGYLDLGLGYRHGLFNLLRQSYESDDIPGLKPFSNRELKYSTLVLHLGFIFR